MLILCLLLLSNQLFVAFNKKRWAFILLLINLVYLGILFYSHAKASLDIRL